MKRSKKSEEDEKEETKGMYRMITWKSLKYPHRSSLPRVENDKLLLLEVGNSKILHRLCMILHVLGRLQLEWRASCPSIRKKSQSYHCRRSQNIEASCSRRNPSPFPKLFLVFDISTSNSRHSFVRINLPSNPPWHMPSQLPRGRWHR